MHPLSPPSPQGLSWRVDASPDERRHDTGRAYVTDESYGFSEREGGTITFYDAPNLGLRDPNAALSAAGHSHSDCPRYDLLVLLSTELWNGRRRLGAIQWECVLTGNTSPLGSVRMPTRRYEQAPVFSRHPERGPSAAESRRMLFRWRQHERTRPLQGGR